MQNLHLSLPIASTCTGKTAPGKFARSITVGNVMPAPPKHGARLLQRVLRENTLDRRTATAKELHALQDALAAERGGWTHCTAAERILIERAASLTLICRSIETWAIKTGVLDSAGALSPPLARGYTSHVMALQRTLATLGIRPDVVERLPNVADYIRQVSTEDGGAT